MILWRPVGLHEMALVYESGMRRFPPRLPGQPIFYPVLDAKYAEQIARDWNTKEEPYAGYVLRFEIGEDYARTFVPHVVGSSRHQELWVPAEELGEFNSHIMDAIVPERAFFGAKFRGHVPEKYGLRGADAFEQISRMIGSMDYSMFDFGLETSANNLSIFLNYPFWKSAGAAPLGVDPVQLERCLETFRRVWVISSRPSALLEEATYLG